MRGTHLICAYNLIRTERTDTREEGKRTSVIHLSPTLDDSRRVCAMYYVHVRSARPRKINSRQRRGVI